MKSAYLPRLGDWVFICILAAGLLLGQRMLNLDSDLGRHLTLGRYVLASGQIPTRDVLSFTRAGEPRPPYEWLAQVVFAIADGRLGLDGVVLLTAGVIAAAFLVVHADARSRGGSPLVAVGLTIWAAAASSLHWLTRPHVFSFLFFAIWLSVLDRLRRGDHRATWQLPLVMLFWANFHGGFIFGFIAWMAYVLGWIIQRGQSGTGRADGAHLALAGVGSFAASTLTPGLLDSWSAVLRNSNPYLRLHTAETMPINLSAPGTWAFLALVVLAVYLILSGRRWLVPAHAVLLLTTAALGIAIMRNIPLFCISAVPILAVWARQARNPDSPFERLEERVQAIDSSSRGYAWAALAMVIAAVIIAGRHIKGAREYYEFDPARFPVAAVDWITSHGLQPRVFNDVNWGGYLLYRSWPERRVFIDSQSDFYGESFIRRYAAIYEGADASESELDQFGITSIILPPDAPIISLLRVSPNWTTVYTDGTAVVLERIHD